MNKYQPLSKASHQFLQGCKSGNDALVKKSVMEGADIHLWDNYAIYMAAREGAIQIIKFLIDECHVDVNIEDSCMLIGAVETDRQKLVKYLISKKADVCARENKLMFAAAANDSHKILFMLIKASSRRNSQLINDLTERAKNANSKRVLKMLDSIQNPEKLDKPERKKRITKAEKQFFEQQTVNCDSQPTADKEPKRKRRTKIEMQAFRESLKNLPETLIVKKNRKKYTRREK